MPKARISTKTKLAAALRCLMIEEDGKLVPAIPYDDARRMTEDEIISLFHFDHGVQEAIGGPTEPWNLTPRFIAEHRKKTAAVDLPAIAKTKRLAEKHEAFRRRILAKSGQTHANDVDNSTTRPKSTLRSRPFPKSLRKFPSRPFRKLDKGQSIR